MEPNNIDVTNTMDAGPNKEGKRGRPVGSKSTCGLCGGDHNRTTCTQRSSMPAASVGFWGVDEQKDRMIERLKEKNIQLNNRLDKAKKKAEMFKNGAKHVIYGIWSEQTRRYHYVGKTFDFRQRAYSHSQSGAIKKMSEANLKGVCVPLKSKWFLDKELGKAWVAKWESYHMMLYNQHKYRLEPSSYNTNSVSTMGDHMRTFRLQKEELERLAADHILRDDSLIDEISVVLDHYEEYRTADEEKGRDQPLSTV